MIDPSKPNDIPPDIAKRHREAKKVLLDLVRILAQIEAQRDHQKAVSDAIRREKGCSTD
jgi:hypothetical protein